MKHTVWLFDKTYHVIDESDYDNGISDVEAAMINKTPIYLNKSFVAGSAISHIEPFGNKDDYGSHTPGIMSGWEKASALLESGQPTMTEREKRIVEIKEQIRANLRKWGGDDIRAKEYLATRKLAKALHDTRDWHLKEWDEFIEAHPRPIAEWEAYETARILDQEQPAN